MRNGSTVMHIYSKNILSLNISDLMAALNCAALVLQLPDRHLHPPLLSRGSRQGVITSSTFSPSRHYTPQRKKKTVQSEFRCQNSESGSVFLSKLLVWEQPKLRHRQQRWWRGDCPITGKIARKITQFCSFALRIHSVWEVQDASLLWGQCCLMVQDLWSLGLKCWKSVLGWILSFRSITLVSL